ncbi:MAG: winged helix-turn-helix transcriptional regulator [Candidatus Hodarchaeales archaeon]|jgi:predicted ArsR family transcriptional regulator
MSNQISEFIEKNDHSSTESTPVIVGKKQPIVHELDRNVLKILEKEGPITRSKLVSLTGIARSTLYDSLLRLILKGYIARFSEDRKQRGRPRVFYQVLQ